MNTLTRLLAVAAGALALAAPAAHAAGEQKHPHPHSWEFEGPFGTYDRASMQRGFQIYQEVCSACHGMQQLDFRHLGTEGGPFFMEDSPNPNDNPIIRAIAAQYVVEDGPDEYGEMFRQKLVPLY